MKLDLRMLDKQQTYFRISEYIGFITTKPLLQLKIQNYFGKRQVLARIYIARIHTYVK